MTSQALRREPLESVAWYALNTFAILFPMADGVRMFTKLPEASLNLWFLIGFSLFLIGIEVIHFNRKHLSDNAPGTRPTDHRVANYRSLLTKSEWLLVVYLILVALATVNSVDFHLSLFGLPQEYGGLIPLAAYGILFFWVSRRVPSSRHTTLIQSVAIGSVIPTIYGILQHIRARSSTSAHLFGGPTIAHTLGLLHIDYLARSYSLFCNADFFGTYMALVMVLTLTLYLSTKNRLAASGYLVLMVMQFFAIAFSSTRSAWLGWLVGSAIVAIFAVRQRHRKWARLAIIILVFLGCFVLVNHQTHNTVASRVSTIATNAKQVVASHNRNSVGSGRWYIWRESIPLVEDHPLLGTGPDTFERVFQPPSQSNQKYLHGQPMANANNAYIQKAVTLGLPALVIVLIFYAMVVTRPLMRHQRRNGIQSDHQDSSRLVSIGIFSAAVCYFVQAFFNMDVVTVAPLFWILLGCLAAL